MTKSLSKLKKELISWKFADEEFIPKKILWLNDKVVQIIAWTDWWLDTKLGFWLSETISELDNNTRLEIIHKSNSFISPLNFERKLQLAKELKLLNLLQLKNIQKLQYLKNAFSHPYIGKYQIYLKKLRDDKEFLYSELTSLIEITKDFDELKRNAKMV